MTDSIGDYDLVFRSSAVDPGDLFVVRVNGREAISSLFEFEVHVETTFGGALEPSQIDALLSGAAYLAFGADEEHKYHGVVREIEMLSMADPSPVHYRLRFVPKMFDTTLTFGTWIYQELSVPEIIKEVLKEAGFQDGKDYEFRGVGAYAKKEYVVQYAESDFHFISRLMEHEGLYYFFEHGDDGAKMVVADVNGTSRPLEGHESIPYDPRIGLADFREAITAFSHTQTVVPRKLQVREYNYRTPSAPMTADDDVDPTGVGHQTYYGEHYKDKAAGKKLAKVRSQEWLAQKNVYHGGGRVRGLRSGHRFTLEQHMLSALDGDYLVTEVTHSVEQAGSGGGANAGYTMEFVAIPQAVQFRPRRVTQKPRLYGVIQGKIDAASDGVRTVPIDEHGRYKVLLPFDIGGAAGGKASRWIRMAQTASGSGFGMHFPLHVGTEVLLTHIEGDPDRPIIVGSVPNHETASPVTSANASQSKIATRHGITVTLDDQS